VLPTNNDSVQLIKCVDTKNTIFIFKNDLVSYIDLSFECPGIATSADLSAIIGFEDHKLQEILSFFRKNGLWK